MEAERLHEVPWKQLNSFCFVEIRVIGLSRMSLCVLLVVEQYRSHLTLWLAIYSSLTFLQLTLFSRETFGPTLFRLDRLRTFNKHQSDLSKLTFQEIR